MSFKNALNGLFNNGYYSTFKNGAYRRLVGVYLESPYQVTFSRPDLTFSTEILYLSRQNQERNSQGYQIQYR